MVLDVTANPAWPVFRHDPRPTVGRPAIRPRGPRKRWGLHIGDYATVYAGSWDQHLYAVGPDGVQLWSSSTLDHIVGSAAVGPSLSD